MRIKAGAAGSQEEIMADGTGQATDAVAIRKALLAGEKEQGEDYESEEDYEQEQEQDCYVLLVALLYLGGPVPCQKRLPNAAQPLP